MLPDSPKVLTNQSIYVVNGTIFKVGEQINVPEKTKIIAGRGRFVIPGLIDAHVHLNDESELAGYLIHGVTGIRNMSGYPFHLRLSNKIEAGQILGPHIITTGPILNSPGPNTNIIQQLVSDTGDARRAVRMQYEQGYRYIKIYSNLRREVYEAIMDEAKSLNMRVTGHTPEGIRYDGVPYQRAFTIPWQDSLGRGIDTFEHIETIVWHALRDDLNIAKMKHVTELLRKNGEAVTPTLIAHRRLVNIADSKGRYLERDGSETISPLVRLFESSAEKYWSTMGVSEYESSHAAFYLKATKILHEAGIPLLTGTDSGGFGLIPGKSMYEELSLLVQAGISPYDALQSATYLPAKVLGFEHSGVIVEGYRANMVILDANPAVKIEYINTVSGVMINGNWLDAEELKQLSFAAKNTSLLRSLFRFLEMKLSF